MILIVEDDPHLADRLRRGISDLGLRVETEANPGDALATFGRLARQGLELVVLDVIIPPDESFNATVTAGGRITGIQLLNSFRAIHRSLPIVLFTASTDHNVLEVAERDPSTHLVHKSRGLDPLLGEIRAILGGAGPLLAARLRSCEPGRRDSPQYERLMVDCLEYLFVPPLPEVLSQVRTASGHEVRDAVLPNYSASGFWEEVQREFESRNIVCEFKNYRNRLPIAAMEQLRVRLDKPALGRFGMLFSRIGPGVAALQAQRDCYSALPSKLVLLLGDEEVLEMIELRQAGEDPSQVLQRQKTALELSL